MWDVLMEIVCALEKGAELSDSQIQLYVWLCLSLALNAAMLLCWGLGVLHRFAQRVRRLFQTNRREIVVQVQRAPVRAAQENKAVKEKQPDSNEKQMIPIPEYTRRPPLKKLQQKQKKRKPILGKSKMNIPSFFAQMPKWNNEEEIL